MSAGVACDQPLTTIAVTTNVTKNRNNYKGGLELGGALLFFNGPPHYGTHLLITTYAATMTRSFPLYFHGTSHAVLN